MTPAPNKEVLLNFEENIETAIVAFLKTRGFEDQVHRTQGVDTLRTGIAVAYEHGQAKDSYTIRKGKRLAYAAYEGTLNIGIYTERLDPAASETLDPMIQTQHSEWRGRLRAIFEQSEGFFDCPSVLPYYAFMKLRELDTQFTQVQWTDITALSWDAPIMIRPEAWPAS